MAEFKKGDVVLLKSGGPLMTVENPSTKDDFGNGQLVTVVFFNGAEVVHVQFVPEVLEHRRT